MKEHFKTIYLIILILISLSYLISRWTFIQDGDYSVMDITIWVIFIVLILSPLFSEIKLFGFSFKTQLKELKNDLRNEIFNLRSEINNNINFNPSVYLNSSQLTKDDFEELLSKHKQSESVEKEEVVEEISIPNDVKEFFKIRYALESKLMEIGKKIRSQYPSLNENFRPPTRVIWYLQEDGIIEQRLANALKYAYNTSSRAIHGEEIHEMTLENVKELAPVLVNELDKILRTAYP